MIPYSYNMVDMGGIDLAEANGTVVDGLYNRIVEAVNSCGDVVLYNWKFAGIEIVPQYTSILLGAIIVINGAIQVTEQDAVTVPGINPILTTLSVTENGIYIPEPPVDGFSSVEVDIDPTLTSLSVTENGVYLPQSPAIGFSSVEVNVDQGPGLCNNNILCNWDFANIVNTRGNSSYSSGYGFDGWSVFQGTVRTSTGGINLVKASNKDFILSGQFLLQSEAVRALLGKTLTLSAMVDNEAGSVTVAITSATGVQGEVLTVGELIFIFIEIRKPKCLFI